MTGQCEPAARLQATALLVQQLRLDYDEGVRLREELEWFFRAVVLSPHASSLAPSRSVDEAWHVLLRQPALYSEFCRATVGRIVKHLPGGPGAQGYELALRDLKALRGELDERFWPRASKTDLIAGCGGSSGDDDEE